MVVQFKTLIKSGKNPKGTNMSRPLPQLDEHVNNIKIVCDLGMNYKYKKAKRMAIFICPECGKEFEATVNSVKVGHKKSCGCIRGLSNKSHGLSKHDIYKRWGSMINRCENQNDASYPRYGGKGISVCQKWRHDFMTFYNWAISTGFKKELEIDRIDSKGNYEPSNCQWISPLENNKKDSLKLTDKEIYKIVALYKTGYWTCRALGKKFNVSKWLISKTIKQNGLQVVNKRNTDVTKS